MKRSFWTRTLGIFLTTICIVAVGSPNAWAVQRSVDVWEGLGENFQSSSGSGAESTIEGSTYVLPDSGAEVVLAEGLEPEDSDVEDQLILNTPQGMGAIAVVPGIGSPESMLELYADAFGDSLDGSKQIYLESDDTFASALYSFDLLELPMLMFITVDANAFPGYLTIQVTIAETNISGAIVSMRENVAINGVPMFDGVDEQDVQNRADDYLEA